MTTYFENAPLTADQMDEEEGYNYGIPVLMQQPGVAVANDNVDMRVMHKKGKHAFILSIVSFILCGLATLSTTMICHIAAMVFAAKSRVSAEKNDYYDSKLMLDWSYICTFAGCFIGGMSALGTFILVMHLVGIAVVNYSQYPN